MAAKTWDQLTRRQRPCDAALFALFGVVLLAAAPLVAWDSFRAALRQLAEPRKGGD